MDHIECAYRRGFHQALALAGTLLWRCKTIEEGRRLVGRAEDEAQDIRHDHGWHGGMMDEINDRLAKPLAMGDRA